MFDEPEETPTERARKPEDQAREKADEFRMHAELAAVFEGCRKFDAELRPGLDADAARHLQRTIGRLEKAKTPESPVLPESAIADAADVLGYADTHDLSTNDYHVYRRPGEVMMVRWLSGDQVESFYGRIQAHFDAALEGYREDERQTHEWKQDPQTIAYLKALDDVKVSMADRYLREPLRALGLFILSTFTADEMDILHLCDYVMGRPAAEVVGTASAPPDDSPTEQERAWFFKMFSLRGMAEGVERMCFFTYLQKSDEF